MGYIASKSLASAIQSPAEAARAPFGETTTEILRESSFWQIEGNEIESPSSHARRHLSRVPSQARQEQDEHAEEERRQAVESSPTLASRNPTPSGSESPAVAVLPWTSMYDRVVGRVLQCGGLQPGQALLHRRLAPSALRASR